MWLEALKGKYEGGKPFQRKDWDQLLGHCMAVTDAPCYIFSRELFEAYPDVKVVLTVRDSVDAWYNSYMDTVQPMNEQFVIRNDIFARIVRSLIPRIPSRDVLRSLVKYTEVGRVPQHGKQWYEEHNQMIRDMVPADQLLEYNVKQGWTPLCKFLGKEAPKEPFPRVNDKEEFQRGMIEFRLQIHAYLKDKIRKSLAVLSIALVGFLSWMILLK